MSLKSEICDAVHALGYYGRIKYFLREQGRAVVYVNGKNLGIYDFVKHTFID